MDGRPGRRGVRRRRRRRHLPLRQRLYAWLDPAGALDGRVRRAVTAIEDRLDEREAGR
ncbi:hypothetical protein ACFQJD_09415 [Haloplanus sp. GCM10025708]|uniref:hypothetical protein n=1 Tax=Haloferacaceae TaxID=1644056 RepID=UPI003609A7E4